MVEKSCWECKFFDGENICCMYNCGCVAILDTEHEALNCLKYTVGKFNWDELEKSNYR